MDENDRGLVKDGSKRVHTQDSEKAMTDKVCVTF